jgi:sulfite reductase alpha subunit-like flavoprotein
MVGPGTGISPMMGFLQAREKEQAEGVSLGPCMVFFGCRMEDDFLHSKQMRAWASNQGVISSLQVAFSRIPGQPKEYVQHCISKIRDAVSAEKLFHDKKGTISGWLCVYVSFGQCFLAQALPFVLTIKT